MRNFDVTIAEALLGAVTSIIKEAGIKSDTATRGEEFIYNVQDKKYSVPFMTTRYGDILTHVHAVYHPLPTDPTHMCVGLEIITYLQDTINIRNFVIEAESDLIRRPGLLRMVILKALDEYNTWSKKEEEKNADILPIGKGEPIEQGPYPPSNKLGGHDA